MMGPSNTLIIFGNFKEEENPSFTLGKYLAEKLQEKKVHTKLLYASDLLRRKETIASIIDEFEVIIFSCPIYFNSLPSDILELMEILWKEKIKIQDQKFFALIIHSLYPESEFNAITVQVAKSFSDKMKFKWLGAMSICQSALLYQKNLKEIRGAKYLVKAIEMMANDIQEGNNFSTKIYQLMNKKIKSVPSYMRYMKKQLKKHAKSNNVLSKIKDQPYCI